MSDIVRCEYCQCSDMRRRSHAAYEKDWFIVYYECQACGECSEAKRVKGLRTEKKNNE